jgi:hypothetical protein
MRRLAELLKRTDTLSTRTDFDPTKFERSHGREPTSPE